ncbi:MAG: hypothetical protein HRT45_02015 [Bdellovibrionales bacterium]|nr:hypothetical protein [Bdellovibrionales bacterium]
MKLKTYKVRVHIFSFVIFFLVAFAPFDRFFIHNYFLVWPYFNWELGFGSVPYKKSWQRLYIDQIDDQIFSPPISLNDYILNHSKKKLRWVATQHYKFFTMLSQANYNKDEKELRRVKGLIAGYWFSKMADREVRYHLAIVDIDPLAYKKDKSLLDKRVIFHDVYYK